MIREQAKASRWAIHSTLSSAIIRLLAMLNITSPSWRPNKPENHQRGPQTVSPSQFFTHVFELLHEFPYFFDHLSHKDDVHLVREIGGVDGADQQAASLGHHVALVQRHLRADGVRINAYQTPNTNMFAVQAVVHAPG